CSYEATRSTHDSGAPTVTNPAPLRSAPRPESEIAPAMPREPPIKSECPYVPLWLSGERGGRHGTVYSIQEIYTKVRDAPGVANLQQQDISLSFRERVGVRVQDLDAAN